MRSESNPDDRELAAIEQRLKQWSPASGSLDRDRILFESGRASAHSPAGRTPWVVLTLGLTAASITFATLYIRERGERQALALALRGSARPALPIAAEPEQNASRDASTSSDSESGYFRIRERIVAKGLDAWPAAVARDVRNRPSEPPRAPLTPVSTARFLDEFQAL
jgi:hypothetical protein